MMGTIRVLFIIYVRSLSYHIITIIYNTVNDITLSPINLKGKKKKRKESPLQNIRD